MSMIRKIGSVQVILLILIVLIIGGLVGGALVYLAATKNQESVQNPTRIVYPKGTVLPTFAPIVDMVKPAVVNVSTEQHIKIPFHNFRQPFDDFGDELLRHFFGEPERNYPMTSLGSGVLVDPAGYILTNNHVIDQADKVNVQLSDGTEYKAEIVGRDAKTDLAVLKITGKGKFPVVVLGDSDDMKVGDWVLAIGNPYKFLESVTHGIVSALGRRNLHNPEEAEVEDYVDFIQTDAPINPGNSGGPLVNLKGEVIGINTMIASQTGSNIGIGFAIPSNLAKTVFAELKNRGKVVRGYLGIRFQELDPAFAKNKFGVEKGIVVGQVYADSPADKAKIQQDDFIVSYDGTKITSEEQFRSMVASTKIGKTVRIELIRNKQLLSVNVTIAEMPSDISQISAKNAEIDLGLTVQNITPEIAMKFHLGKATGVLVTDIEQGSVAESASIKIGDVISEINNQAVKNTVDFNTAVNKLRKGDKIYLKVFRDGDIIYITFESE
jgi:serine protease Do